MTGMDPLGIEPLPQEPQGPQPQGVAVDPKEQLRIAMRQSSGIPDEVIDPSGDVGYQGMLRAAMRQSISEMVDQENQKAKGFGESLSWHASAFAKSAADGVMYAAGDLSKVLAGIGTLITEGDVTSGYIQQERDMIREMGSDSPDSIDAAHYIRRRLGLVRDTKPIEAGRIADELIQKRLGADAIYAQTTGFMLSFMTGAGRNIGKVGEIAALPMAKVAERWLAKKAAASPELAQEILSSGNVWGALASSEKWKESATILQRMTAAAGRNVQDVMGTTGANILQSYAMSPEDERVRQMWAATYMSPFMVPIARAGQRIGQAMVNKGISPESVEKLTSAYDKFQRGEMTAVQLDTIARKSTPIAMRGFASAVTSAFEGSAFTFLSPESHELIGKWLSGDADAGADLVRMMAATSMGVAVTKYGIPADLSPMFKQLRPDINTLQLRMDAETNRLAMEKSKAESVSPEEHRAAMLAKSDSIVAQAKSEQAQGQKKLEEDLGEKIPRDEKRVAMEAEDRFVGLLEQSRATVEQQYGWAREETVSALRGNWEAEFVELQGPTTSPGPLLSGSIKLKFGETHEVTLSKNADSNTVLSVPENVRDVLKSLGREVPETLTGDAAHKTLDDLALAGLLMKNLGAVTYGRKAMQEIRPNVWSYGKETGETYTMGLDGKSSVYGAFDNKVLRQEEHAVIGGHGMNQVWDGPTASALHEALMAKRALSPDPLVDGILGNAIITARFIEGPTGDQVRQFLDSIDPQALLSRMTVDGDRLLAMDIGSLATGTHNAEALVAEIQKGSQAEQAYKELSAQGDEFADALSRDPGAMTDGPVLPENIGEVNANQERNAYLDAMNEAAPVSASENRASMSEAATAAAAEPVVEAAPGEAKSAPKSAKVKMSSDQAAVLSKFIPKKSQLGKQVAKMNSGRGEVEVSAKELASVAEKWAKYAPTELEKAADNVLYQRQAQSADAWIGNALDALGVKYQKSAEIAREPQYVSISEQVSRRLREPGKQPAETAGKAEPGKAGVVREQMAEAAKKTVTETYGGIPISKGFKEAMGKGIRKAVDYIVRDISSVLSRRGIKMGSRVRDARARAGQFEGKALQISSKLQKLASARGTKEEFQKLLVSDQPIAGDSASTRSRLSDLIDGRAKPNTPLEKQVAEVGKAFNESLRDSASEAGSLREKEDGSFEPVMKSGATVLQQVQGSGLRKVMGSPELRKAFFESLAKTNKLFTDGRRLTGSDLEAAWIEHKAKRSAEGGSEMQSAAEFTRRFKEYPEQWKGPDGKTYEIQESNPWTKLRRIATRQAGRAATVEEFGTTTGSTAKDAELLARAKAEGWSPAVIRALERGGIDREIGNTFKELLSSSTEADANSIKRQMELVASRLQGTELIKTAMEQKAPELKQYWSNLQALRSSSMSSISFIKDIPDMIRGSQFSGVTRLVKAIASVARNRREFTIMLERDGIIQHQMGDYLVHEAKGILKKSADAISWVAAKTERAKAWLAAKQIELMINDVNRGRGTEMDYYVIEELIGVEGIRGKKIEGDLRVQVMKQGVEFYTSRTTKGSYSRFADDPRVTEAMVFQKFATKRLESHMKIFGNIAEMRAKHGADSSQYASAKVVAAKTILGIIGMGLAGDWLTEGIVGMFTEGDLDGFAQFYDEATASVGAFAAQAFESSKNQVVGGPASTVLRMGAEPGTAKSWTDATSYSAVAYAIATAIKEAGDKDWSAGVHLLQNTGVVPANRIFSGWARAGWMGQDPDMLRASRQVWNWRRENSLMPAGGGDRTRPDEFYEAIGKSVNSLQRGMDVNATMAETANEIRSALELAPAESVAASIRGHRLIANLTPMQRQELFASINDPERVTQIIQFDEAMTDMAKKIGKMEGARDNGFEQTMKAVSEQAALGSSDQWREVAQTAIENAELGIEAGQGTGVDVQEFARNFAMYPEHFGTVFEGRKLRALQSMENSSDRANMIWVLLMRRARDNLKQTRRDELRARNQ